MNICTCRKPQFEEQRQDRLGKLEATVHGELDESSDTMP